MTTKKKKKTELKVGQIWGVLPLEKTLEVRTITWWYSNDPSLEYALIYGDHLRISLTAFRAWITRTGPS